MPTITKIEPQQRRPNRRSVYIDGQFAFGCNVNVVARFRLREGMAIDAALRRAIEEGEVRQEAFDHATRLLGRRRQSERELRVKLGRKQQYGQGVIDAVIADLKRLSYVDDERFARERAADQARAKRHGRARAVQELRKAGIEGALANRAAAQAFEGVDARGAALDLARRRVPSLSRLDGATARRRLIGFLQRRGFDYETVQYAVERALSSSAEG